MAVLSDTKVAELILKWNLSVLLLEPLVNDLIEIMCDIVYTPSSTFIDVEVGLCLFRVIQEFWTLAFNPEIVINFSFCSPLFIIF